MTVKGLCVADKKKHFITKNPEVVLDRTRTGVKARIVGYSPRCKSSAGKMVKMSAYVANAPLAYTPASCPSGKMRNPVSGRCNIKGRSGAYISRYTGKQKKTMRSKRLTRQSSSKKTASKGLLGLGIF